MRKVHLPNPVTLGAALSFSKGQVWLALFIVYTGIFVLVFGYRYLDDLARAHSGTFGTRFLEEFTGAYSVFLLLPLVFRMARAYLFQPKSWSRKAALHLLGAVLFSFLHTTIMALSRQVIAPVIGLGPYDYGIMGWRYPMEFSNDLLVYTTIVLAFYFVQRLRIAHVEQLAAAELQTKLAEAQLHNLRLQLQPHFLFNTLNTISEMMYEDIRAADAMLQQLSEILRLALRTAHSQEISLTQELEVTKLYLQIMKRRFEEKLQVTYHVEPEVDKFLVPQLILQPLVENSLRHGFKNSASGIDIVITAAREGGSLILKVLDSGTGLKVPIGGNGPRLGMGLANIRGRLERLYGFNQHFEIASRVEGGTEVTLRFPLRSPVQLV